MAGFFGLFNYEKEGPGIQKNAPKKRAPIVFFEIYGRKFWQLFYANLLFFLTNFLVVTRGLADVGLCKISRNFAREKHAFVREDFFETMGRNWKQALLVGIINLAVTALLIFNASYYFLGMFPDVWGIFGVDTTGLQPMTLGALDYAVIAVTAFGYIVFTWMKYYIPLLLVTFKYSTKSIYVNSFKFAIVGLKRNLLISVILIALYAIVGALFFAFGSWGIGILVLIVASLFLPSFRSLLIQFTIFPLVQKFIIDPYYKEHPDADKQLRRDLNLEVEETVEEKAEVVFDDARPITKEEMTIPRQYSEGELRRFNAAANDEDETI